LAFTAAGNAGGNHADATPPQGEYDPQDAIRTGTSDREPAPLLIPRPGILADERSLKENLFDFLIGYLVTLRALGEFSSSQSKPSAEERSNGM